MRCKVGDLAILIRVETNPLLLHKLVTVIGRHDRLEPGRRDWVIDIHGHPSYHSTGLWKVWDRDLRPIRDSDGTDETLTWKDVPKGVPA